MTEPEQSSRHAGLEELFDFLDETPNKLRAFTAGLSARDLSSKESEDEFSTLENICHLRDLELQGYTPRIKRIFSEVEPVLADFDGARVAAESDYNSELLDLALAAFTTSRSENIRVLRSLTDEQLNRTGRLEGVGRVSLRQLAEKMREHDEGHLEDLRVLRLRLDRSQRAGASSPS